MGQGDAPQLRNPKYRDLVEWAVQLQFKIDGINPAIYEVANTFKNSIDRILCLAKLPAAIGGQAMRIQLCIDTARLNLLGTLEGGDEQQEANVQVEVCRLWPVLYQAIQTNAHFHTQREAEFVDDACGKVDLASKGVDALLASVVIGMWTAFEVLATDMWEDAMNFHPVTLSLLKGEQNRITKGIKSPLAKSEKADAEISKEKAGISLEDIHHLTKQTFDLSGCMGTILKRRFPFQTLSGIRVAYSKAFAEHSKRVDAALGNLALDALAITRNLLVHRGGIIDQKYFSQQKTLSLAPFGEINARLNLDGPSVRTLIDTVLKASIELIEAVDKWLKTP
jgi:hypothetical protein